MNNRIYISGRITGDPYYKIRFLAAEKTLRLAFHSCSGSSACRTCPFYDPHNIYLCRMHELKFKQPRIVNPINFGLDGYPYWLQMAVCLVRLARCHYVYFLNGWEQSRGARLEHRLATALHRVIIYQH